MRHEHTGSVTRRNDHASLTRLAFTLSLRNDVDSVLKPLLESLDKHKL